MIEKTICELFAGVGGFRIGLEKASDDWNVVWMNQWEPNKKQQHAFNCYTSHYGEKPEYVNKDINDIDKSTIPNHNLLVGGFPCLVGSSLVLTKDGYKELIEVKSGDMVLSHDNKYHEVVKFMNQGIKQVFTISGIGFDDIKATINHKFYVRRKKGKHFLSPQWASVDYLLNIGCQNFYIGSFISLHEEKVDNAYYDGNYVWLPITSINPDAEEPVYDIEVKDSHSFVVNNCITHNCQDYSVANTGAKGIEGKKGVLWWAIRDILEIKRPKFILLENVDRLLKSPAKQRGRDFGIILACLNDLGYSVEWRVITASDYGFAQKRKRVFIFAYHNNTSYHEKIKNDMSQHVIHNSGFFYKYFPIENNTTGTESDFTYKNIYDISDNFQFNFLNSGIMTDNKIYTEETNPVLKTPTTLSEILEKNVPPKYNAKDLERWKYLKGNKRILRTTKEGFEYWYSEGAMAYPDFLDRPARTMLTSEGTINRSSHILADPETGEYRILTPVEAERINGFPDGWTASGMPEKFRYFCMGNALVVNLITNMGYRLSEIFEDEY